LVCTRACAGIWTSVLSLSMSLSYFFLSMTPSNGLLTISSSFGRARQSTAFIAVFFFSRRGPCSIFASKYRFPIVGWEPSFGTARAARAPY
jgi:hypothetical protein